MCTPNTNYVAWALSMELTKAEYSMYIGTLNAIVKLIEDEPKMTTKRLRHMLIAEIDTISERTKEDHGNG